VVLPKKVALVIRPLRGGTMDLKFTSSIATRSVKTGTSQRGDSEESSARNTGRRTDSYIRMIPSGRPVKDLTNASAAEWRQQQWHKEQEREWENRLSDLRQCICELLIKNQQLRESLTSATSHQSKESA
jgi:hypothetical protein